MNRFNEYKSSNVLVNSFHEYLLPQMSQLDERNNIHQSFHMKKATYRNTKTEENHSKQNCNSTSISAVPNQYCLFPVTESPCYQSQFIQSADRLSPISTCSSSSCSLSPTYSTNSSFSPIVNTRNQSSNKFQEKKLPLRSSAIDIKQFIETSKQSNCSKNMFCTFCKNNNETEEVYRSHILKDTSGKIVCPILKLHKCPTCGASGEQAHTITYCKKYQNQRKLEFLQKEMNKINNKCF